MAALQKCAEKLEHSMIPFTRLDTARLQENLECDTPPAEDVAAMAEFLDIHPKDSLLVQEVAILACAAPLPDGYVEIEGRKGTVLYRQVSTGRESQEHPLDDYFRELIARRRAAANARGSAPHAEAPPVQVCKSNEVAMLPSTSVHKPPSNGNSPPRMSPAPIVGKELSQPTEFPTVRDAERSTTRAHTSTAADLATSVEVATSDSKIHHQCVDGDSLISGEGSCASLPSTTSDPSYHLEQLDPKCQPEERFSQLKLKRSFSFSSIEEGLTRQNFAYEQGTSEPPHPMKTLARLQNSTCENISVAVRLRDHNTAQPAAWKISPTGNELSLLDERAISGSTRQALGNHQGSLSFSFNAVFHGGSTTRDVYRPIVQDIVHSALDGINGCVLAFGGTGSGKTHTMTGDSANQGGVVTLALGDVFAEAGKRSTTHDVTVAATMCELYDEQITDLFAAPGTGALSSYQPNIRILEDTAQGTIQMRPITTVPLQGVKGAIKQLRLGLQNRTMSATGMNDRSSRAHTILQLHVRVAIKAGGDGPAIRSAVLTFVDLAGCERLAQSKTASYSTESSRVKMQESTSINQSLLMLGLVVGQLSESHQRKWLPTRNSKLTRLLAPSLGGNSRTAIIATIHPDISHVDSSLQTLRFAARAMKVQNSYGVNETATATLKTKLQKDMDGLIAPMLQQRITSLEKVSKLESEKSLLMDRVEDMSTCFHTSPALHTTCQDPKKATAVTGEASKALSSILRIAGRQVDINSVKLPKTVPQKQQTTATEAIAAVRRLKLDRDTLREKLNELQPLLVTSQQHVQAMALMESMAAAVTTMESLVGGPNPAVSDDGNLLERVEDLVAAVAIQKAEMSTLSRQHAACEFLLSAAEERIQDKLATDEEHAKLYTQLLQIATTVDVETKQIWEVCCKRRHTSESDTTADESSIDTFLSGQLQSPSFSPSGSAAVQFARFQYSRATMLDEQVSCLLAERQQLQIELKDVQSSEQLHSSRLLEAHENRELRAKVSKLSKELAALLKERNVLLHAVHGSTEHEVMCMHSSSMPHAVEEKLSGETLQRNSTMPASLPLLRKSSSSSPQRGGGGSWKPDFDCRPMSLAEGRTAGRMRDRVLKAHSHSPDPASHGNRQFRKLSSIDQSTVFQEDL